jgi:hypothetical protein
VLLGGTVLSCKDIIKSSGDSQLATGPIACFGGHPASPDTAIYPRVYGAVYFYGDPQNEAIVTLIHEAGEVWLDTTEATTQGDGQYGLRCRYAGWYWVRASYSGENSLSRTFYIRPLSFDQVLIDLHIGYHDPSPNEK